MKVRIFYRPVREIDELETDVNEFLDTLGNVPVEDITLSTSNHGVYAMIRYA